MRAIGVDAGDVRVGLAISDELGLFAHPLETIDVRVVSKKFKASGQSNNDAAAAVAVRIAALAAERAVETVIVGLPLNMDGSAGAAVAKARALMSHLRELGQFKVVEWDERMTTLAAKRQFREAGRSQKQTREKIDQAAAVVLLQSWLDSEQIRTGRASG